MDSKEISPIEQWLMLLNAETESDLKEIEEITTIPEIKKAIAKIRVLSKDEEVVKEAEERERELREQGIFI